MEQELCPSSAHCQTEGGGTISLQLLEFKTHLLDAVEELHIRRDAEMRFEDQISKLVLEKQELEWEKESLQHLTETAANQHTESLTSVKKQAKLRSIEEEKGKYQVSAELKDKEINNLKEELKSLQLLKYNLEKKSSELEQKLALQSRSKDSHLNQLGEVEKRFSALSRQCALVKQAHEKLEQKVDEAMRINKNLTSANEKQEVTIVSLKKELDEVSNKLIMVKMTSVRHNKTHSPPGREQHVQQLHQRLNMETEMNKKLMEENEADRAEKQEVLRSLQHTQQLLLSQTQTVRRVEQELETQRETYQGLKQEHEVMREKSKATEDKVARLMEGYAASKTSWDKEKTRFLDRIKSEQEGLQAAKEAYDDLRQKHTELSLQAKSQAQHINELEMRDSSQSLGVSAQLFPTLVEEIRGEEETLNKPTSSSGLPGLGSLQHLISSQAKKPERLEDTGAGTKIVAIGATGGEEVPNHQQLSQTVKHPLNPPGVFACPLTCSNLLRPISGTTPTESNMLNKSINNSHTSESDPDVVSDLIRTIPSVPDDGLQITKGNHVSGTAAAASPECRSLGGSVDFLTGETNEEGIRRMKEQGGKDAENEQANNNREEEERNTEQQVQGEDVKQGGSAGGERGTLVAQTTDIDSEGSAKDAGEASNPETETEDRAGGDDTDGVKERGKTAETQIRAQTTADTTTENRHALQVTDFMNAESPLAVCEPSDVSQSLSRGVTQKDADSSHVDNRYEAGRDGHTHSLEERQGVSHSLKDARQEKPSDKTAADFPAEILNQSTECTSQANVAPPAGRSDGTINVQEWETSQTETCGRSDIIADMKQTHEPSDKHVSEECVSVRKPLPQSQKASEEESGQLQSVGTDDEDGEPNQRKEGQLNVDTPENNPCEAGGMAREQSAPESELETGECQEHEKTDRTEDAGVKSEAELKLSVRPSHENDASSETSGSKCQGDTLREDPAESSLPCKKTYRSLFEWGAAQRSSRTMSDVSMLHQLVQGSMSDQNTTGPGGFLGHPPSTIPMFLNSKPSKVPSVIMRASDLLNASSVSGAAASSRRHQLGEWEAVEETCQETTATDRDSRPLPSTSLPASASSTGHKLSWQTTPERSRAPTAAAGPSSESDWEASCSQEREDQQSSFRAQISKIEQFLNTERLRLPKRRRTDN